MSIKKCSNPMNIKGIEEWMSQFFSDPFTSILDEHTFRVDLFETSEDFIIEVELGEQIKKECILITVNTQNVKIEIPHMASGTANKEKDIKSRTIILPYPIDHRVIEATISNGILEIKISKTCSCKNKQSLIPIDG